MSGAEPPAAAQPPAPPDQQADPEHPLDRWAGDAHPSDASAILTVYEDAHLLVVRKPAGWLVHRSALAAHDTRDVLSTLQAQRDEPLWPAHRLDKGTSGLLVLARNAHTVRFLNQAWAAGRVHKTYLCVVRGWPAPQGVIDRALARDPELPSAGQPLLASRTAWRVMARHHWPVATHPRFPGTRLALLAVMPHTGRRHQIRRHLKHLGHPLLGDATHGKGPLNRAMAEAIGQQRLWLHAWQLVLPHPNGGPPLHLLCEPGASWQTWLTDSSR